MKKKGTRSALVLAILAFIGCSGVAWLCAGMDATVTHMFYSFWHSDSFFSGNFGWVVGLAGALFAFLMVMAIEWLRTRRS